MVERIFVEKKEGFDVEAKGRLADFKETLEIKSLEKVRIFNRYDVENIEKDDLKKSIVSVFSEPAVDVVYKKLPGMEDAYVFAVEYLPGQYDQRADSAAQCVSLLTMKERPTVKTAVVYALFGNLSDEDKEKIKKYVINPVDSREASLEKPKTLQMQINVPKEVDVLDGFIEKSDDELKDLRAQMGFAMSDNDIIFAKNYFAGEKRNPTITEMKVIDTYWSDHCRHTTFQTKLEKVQFGEGAKSEKAAYERYISAREEMGRKKDVCLMDLATMYPREMKGKLPDLDVSEEINACSIKHKLETSEGEKDYLIMFKNETHNHPTEIEPFGGAATCLGGAIRDPLSGRSYVYQAMRVTGSADPRESIKDTMEHKLPQRKITKEAAHGYSSYGNQIGLATGLVNEVYHPGYKAKRMEIGAVIAAAPAENVVRERPQEGDLIILIGGATGRDGCGGATGSSKAHDEKSIETCGAEVQKGNAPTERKLQRLFRKKEFSQLIKRCNDFGAGGVCVAIGELAEGLDIDLDAVPKKYEGLDGTELAISESQERMAVVIDKTDLNKIMQYADEENLEATLVAKVTSKGRMRLFWQGKIIVDLSREFLDSNGAPQFADALIPGGETSGLFDEEIKDSAKDTLLSLMGDLNICSQKGLSEMFDASIGAASVTMPFGGKTQLTPIQTMAAKVPCDCGETTDASLMSYGFDPYIMEKNQYAGAIYSVVNSVAKIVAAGGRRENTWLTFQEYFERMTSDPKTWGKPLSALLGAYVAQKELEIAAIGGKDSMSGSFMDIHVPPTLCSFAVCMTKAENVITPEFKKPGNKIYVMDIARKADSTPDFDDLKAKYEKLANLIAEKKVVSAYAVERGGVLAGAVKCAFGNKLGVDFVSDDISELAKKKYGAVMVEAESLSDDDFKLVAKVSGIPMVTIGDESIVMDDLKDKFTGALESVFPTHAKAYGIKAKNFAEKKEIYVCKHKVAQPKVIIPVFPGTNCEYDTAKAFERAGAQAQVLVIRNLCPSAIEESISALEKAIKESQIIMLPGGFSGGDEPDGSGKFIATTFRNPKIKDAVSGLLEQRDGLMLGICNGFQALIKLGLVPYGKICDMRDDSPTLTYNNIGRHVSTIVRTRITSANSPWLMGVEAGDIHSVAVSHGEGRFVATTAEIDKLFANGQVATQYVDDKGEPTMDTPYNPNGSMYAIEGIMSADGRVLGKMGHSERATAYTFKNVPGNQDQKIFESGVKYFK